MFCKIIVYIWHKNVDTYDLLAIANSKKKCSLGSMSNSDNVSLNTMYVNNASPYNECVVSKILSFKVL